MCAVDQCNGLLDTEHNEVDVAALFPEISLSSEASLRLNARREIGSAAVLPPLFIITCAAVPARASHQDFPPNRERKKQRRLPNQFSNSVLVFFCFSFLKFCFFHFLRYFFRFSFFHVGFRPRKLFDRHHLDRICNAAKHLTRGRTSWL